MADEIVHSIQMRLMNAWQRVLFRMWVAKLRNEKFYLTRNPDNVISGGYLPIYAFQGSQVGGSAGDVRLRYDVRLGHNFPIDMKIHKWTLYGQSKHTPIYRLDCVLTAEDWEEIFEQNARYRYVRAPVCKPKVKVVVDKQGQLCFA